MPWTTRCGDRCGGCDVRDRGRNSTWTTPGRRGPHGRSDYRGATDESDVRAGFSNYVPARSVPPESRRVRFTQQDSASCSVRNVDGHPHVAEVAALYLAPHTTATPATSVRPRHRGDPRCRAIPRSARHVTSTPGFLVRRLTLRRGDVLRQRRERLTQVASPPGRDVPTAAPGRVMSHDG